MDDDWLIINYECLLDKDEFTIIDINIRELIDDNGTYLETVREFLEKLRSSFSEKQAMVDIPREECSINNRRVYSYDEFIKNLSQTVIIPRALMVATQASIFPLIRVLFIDHYDPKNNIHVTDFPNPLRIDFLVIDKDHIDVRIAKKFRLIKLDQDSNPHILKEFSVYMYLNIGDDDGGVRYKISKD